MTCSLLVMDMWCVCVCVFVSASFCLGVFPRHKTLVSCVCGTN